MMRILPTPLDGVHLIEIDPIIDERGFFARAWCSNTFAAHGLEDQLVQGNLSSNTQQGTIRGMHYQVAPHAETKIVRCIRGTVFDVAVDVRPDSPTYLQWVGYELSADNRRSLYIGEGFAHGFQTLTPDSELFYLTSHSYQPEAERGLRHDDPAIDIDWPLTPSNISAKDRGWALVSATI